MRSMRAGAMCTLGAVEWILSRLQLPSFGLLPVCAWRRFARLPAVDSGRPVFGGPPASCHAACPSGATRTRRAQRPTACGRDPAGLLHPIGSRWPRFPPDADLPVGRPALPPPSAGCCGAPACGPSCTRRLGSCPRVDCHLRTGRSSPLGCGRAVSWLDRRLIRATCRGLCVFGRGVVRMRAGATCSHSRAAGRCSCTAGRAPAPKAYAFRNIAVQPGRPRSGAAACTRRVGESTACCRTPLACRVPFVRAGPVFLLVSIATTLVQVVVRMRFSPVCSVAGRCPGAAGVRRAATRSPCCMPFRATCTRRAGEPTACCRGGPLACRVPLVLASPVFLLVPIGWFPWGRLVPSRPSAGCCAAPASGSPCTRRLRSGLRLDCHLRTTACSSVGCASNVPCNPATHPGRSRWPARGGYRCDCPACAYSLYASGGHAPPAPPASPAGEASDGGRGVFLPYAFGPATARALVSEPIPAGHGETPCRVRAGRGLGPLVRPPLDRGRLPRSLCVRPAAVRMRPGATFSSHCRVSRVLFVYGWPRSCVQGVCVPGTLRCHLSTAFRCRVYRAHAPVTAAVRWSRASSRCRFVMRPSSHSCTSCLRHVCVRRSRPCPARAVASWRTLGRFAVHPVSSLVARVPLTRMVWRRIRSRSGVIMLCRMRSCTLHFPAVSRALPCSGGPAAISVCRCAAVTAAALSAVGCVSRSSSFSMLPVSRIRADPAATPALSVPGSSSRSRRPCAWSDWRCPGRRRLLPLLSPREYWMWSVRPLYPFRVGLGCVDAVGEWRSAFR